MVPSRSPPQTGTRLCCRVWMKPFFRFVFEWRCKHGLRRFLYCPKCTRHCQGRRIRLVGRTHARSLDAEPMPAWQAFRRSLVYSLFGTDRSRPTSAGGAWLEGLSEAFPWPTPRHPPWQQNRRRGFHLGKARSIFFWRGSLFLFLLFDRRNDATASGFRVDCVGNCDVFEPVFAAPDLSNKKRDLRYDSFPWSILSGSALRLAPSDPNNLVFPKRSVNIEVVHEGRKPFQGLEIGASLVSCEVVNSRYVWDQIAIIDILLQDVFGNCFHTPKPHLFQSSPLRIHCVWYIR